MAGFICCTPHFMGCSTVSYNQAHTAMTLIALGINHNTASVEVREAVAFSPSQIAEALREACSQMRIQEVAILSTCNRTELYAEVGASGVKSLSNDTLTHDVSHADASSIENSTSNLANDLPGKGDVDALLRWLAAYHNVSFDDLKASHYAYESGDAARHMMKVASGLDSLVLGEPQILGQMKSAYATASEAGSVRSGLHNAFQSVFSVAKRVRSETAIGENPVSVAYAAVSLAQQIFSDLKDDTALLIGAGETIELVARHLAEQGLKNIIVANRTLSNAVKLAAEFDGEAILLADIPEHLQRADIVIASTASQLPVLGKGAVEAALKARRHKPIFMVDIAVPRDIEPQVGELADVYLYTVDDLKDVIDENMRSREQAAQIATDIVEEGVHAYEKELRSQDAVTTVKAFRRYVDGVRESELAKAQKNLAAGNAPEQVLEQLARNFANKLMHTPTSQLRKAGAEGNFDAINIFKDLFALEDSDAPSQPNQNSETS